MSLLGIIGGSGLARMPDLEITERRELLTPYGSPSAPVLLGRLAGVEVAFMPRHGERHTIPPHRINYRGNLWALKACGVDEIVALAAVGGIRVDMGPGTLVIPDQIVDYTHGRRHTFFESELDGDPHLLPHVASAAAADSDLAAGNLAVTHIDFTQPYCQRMRSALLSASRSCGEPTVPEGTYGATQGPRLETAAEIRRLERDGCDLVGMTGMPEAALARELDLCYACCAFVVNWAAGKVPGPILMDAMERTLATAAVKVQRLLLRLLEERAAGAATD